MQVWVVGKYIDYVDEGSVWDIGGVFDNEFLAIIESLGHDDYFIGPMELNKSVSLQDIEWENCYYPNLEIKNILQLEMLTDASLEEKQELPEDWDTCGGKFTTPIKQVSKEEINGKLKVFHEEAKLRQEVVDKNLANLIKIYRSPGISTAEFKPILCYSVSVDKEAIQDLKALNVDDNIIRCRILSAFENEVNKDFTKACTPEK